MSSTTHPASPVGPQAQTPQAPAVETASFRVSSSLKDLIGRHLLTNDYIAVFELVKNSFDAHARRVHIVVLPDKIIIADDGKGMSREDIAQKWLFVAYSAKKDGTEDKDYRHDIGRRTNSGYAGAKGVGRFSCDRLGQTLTMHTCSDGHPVQVLRVDWPLYEEDQQREIGKIRISLDEKEAFPDAIAQYVGATGTVLEIQSLRSTWDRMKLLGLRTELAKLINPFQSDSEDFQIVIEAPAEADRDQELLREAQATNDASSRSSADYLPLVNGPVSNPILDVLRERTTSVKVDISADGVLTTRLEDRGEKIYETREANPYPGLAGTSFDAEVYFLNRSAKQVFARRMGVSSYQFGSIFVFRNGFRVYPIGHQADDGFGLARRHQHGVKRYLSTRDLIGRVQIDGVPGLDETTGREGLIRTSKVNELIECVQMKCVRRLERYVVDISWKDTLDKDQSDASRMHLDDSSAQITQLISNLAGTLGIELVDYNPEIVRIVDEKSSSFESSLKALEVLAGATGDQKLIDKVEQSQRRIRELEVSEAEARDARKEADEHAANLEKKVAQSEERNRFLVAAASLDEDTVLNLHHQILTHASDVKNGVGRMMGKLRRSNSLADHEWIEFLEQVAFRNSQIITAARFATKSGYRHQSTQIEADLAVYIEDYILNVASIWAPQGLEVMVDRVGVAFSRGFRPIEIGIVIDNLIANARKAGASTVHFSLEINIGTHRELKVHVADNGDGWDSSLQSLESALEKGVTTTNGSGLGLHHVRQVLTSLGGSVELDKNAYSGKLTGAHLILRIPE